MRDNSGKGDSNTGLLDPTIKEQEAARSRSGQAPLEGKATARKRAPSPDNRGGGGR